VESNARYVQSKLNFVDLAGSERLSKTQVRSALIRSLSLSSAVIGLNVMGSTPLQVYAGTINLLVLASVLRAATKKVVNFFEEKVHPRENPPGVKV